LIVSAVIAIVLAASSPQGSVSSVHFKTNAELPILQVAPELQPVGELLLRGVDHLSEGPLLVAVVTLGQRQFNLTPPQVGTLTRNFKQVYGKIATDPAFAGVPSAIPQALSQDPQRPGHYFLYRPAVVDADTPTIVFLHGFGGNFQFYTWLLKEHFPDHVIIAPSYGIAWTPTRDARAYLDEVLIDATPHVGVKPHKNPWLIALSAGGPAGFAFYNESPSRFQGLIALATCPAPAQVPELRHDLKVLMLNGTSDDRFPIARVREIVRPIAARSTGWQNRELESDHFFLLTEADATFAAVADFMAHHP
jgi:predicted esterase